MVLKHRRRAREPARDGLGSTEHASLEETMRLLLHAVRKGVEVIAEAVSLHLPVREVRLRLLTDGHRIE